jgi:mono/diheme cytochrome c family protein
VQNILAAVTIVTLCATAAFGANAKAGQAIYDKSCKSCHGADGTPNAAAAKMMKVDMKDLKASEVQALSDEDMKEIITKVKGKIKDAQWTLLSRSIQPRPTRNAYARFSAARRAASLDNC